MNAPYELLREVLRRDALEWEAAKLPRLFPFIRAELAVYLLTTSETSSSS